MLRLRKALARGKPWNLLTLRLGSLQLEALLEAHRRGAAADSDRVEETISTLTSAIDAARKQDLDGVLPFALMNRGLALRIRGSFREALADTEEASKLAPRNEQIVGAFAEQLFALGGNLDEAIATLRTLESWEPAGQRSALLATLLLLRGNAGDSLEALRIVELELPSCMGRPAGERADLVRLAIELLHLESRGFRAEELIDGLEGFDLPSVDTHAIRARDLLKRGKGDAAKAEIQRALAEVGEGLLYLRTGLSITQTLEELGMHSEAFATIRKSVTPRSDPGAVALLLRCARRAGEDGFVLEACDELALHGRHTEESLGVHVESLLAFTEVRRAIEVVSEYLSAHPEAELVRLNFCRMVLQAGRFDLAVGNAPILERSGRLFTARCGPGVVQVLWNVGSRVEALTYAYRLWRKFPNEASCNRALVQVLFASSGDKLTIGGSGVVTASSAVRLATGGDEAGRWVVLEDEATQPGLWDEYPPTHVLSQSLLGRSVGEVATLPGGRMVERQARVLEVLDKRIFRAQWILKTFQDRFPESVFFESLDIGDEQGEVDPAKLLQVLKVASGGREELLAAYKSERLPLTCLVRAAGKSTLEVVESLAASSGRVLHASEGSAAEVSATLQDLSHGRELVIEPSALASLFILNQADLLVKLGGRLVVCESSLMELRAYCSEMEQGGVGGFLGLSRGRIVLQEISEDERRDHASAVDRFIKIVEAACTVVGGRDLALAPASLRGAFREIATASAVESVATAVARGATLWTDDLVLTRLLRREVGEIAFSSTRNVAQHLAESGRIAFDELSEIVLALLGAGFTFTSISAELAVRIVELKRWETSNPYLARLFKEFENPRWSSSVASSTCSRTLELVWRSAPSDFLARTFTANLLGRVLSRADASEVLASMRAAAMPLLALLPMQERALREAIEMARRTGAATL